MSEETPGGEEQPSPPSGPRGGGDGPPSGPRGSGGPPSGPRGGGDGPPSGPRGGGDRPGGGYGDRDGGGGGGGGRFGDRDGGGGGGRFGDRDGGGGGGRFGGGGGGGGRFGDREGGGGRFGGRGDRPRAPQTVKGRLRAKARKKARRLQKQAARSGKIFGRKKVSRLTTDTQLEVDYRDPKSLRYFLTETGKIVPRRISGNTAKQQREVCLAIKRARHLALVAYPGQVD